MAVSKDELIAFHRFAVDKIDDADSLHDLVDIWEFQNRTPEEHAEDVAAIRASINDMENGDKGRPAEKVVQELRAEFGQAPRV